MSKYPFSIPSYEYQLALFLRQNIPDPINSQISYVDLYTPVDEDTFTLAHKFVSHTTDVIYNGDHLILGRDYELIPDDPTDTSSYPVIHTTSSLNGTLEVDYKTGASWIKYGFPRIEEDESAFIIISEVYSPKVDRVFSDQLSSYRGYFDNRVFQIEVWADSDKMHPYKGTKYTASDFVNVVGDDIRRLILTSSTLEEMGFSLSSIYGSTKMMEGRAEENPPFYIRYIESYVFTIVREI